MLSDQEKADFLTALGEEFARATVPPTPEDASIHDCCEPVLNVLGDGVMPQSLTRLDAADHAAIAAAFAEYFETRLPSVEQVADAIASTLRRWPPNAVLASPATKRSVRLPNRGRPWNRSPS